MLENTLVFSGCPMLLKSLECAVSKLVNSDTCPRPRQVLDDGSLAAVIGWPLRARMANDVSQAAHYLHSRGMVHLGQYLIVIPVRGSRKHRNLY